MNDKNFCPICNSPMKHEDDIAADTINRVPTETCLDCGFEIFTTHFHNPAKLAIWVEHHLRYLAVNILAGEKACALLRKFSNGSHRNDELLRGALEHDIPPRYEGDKRSLALPTREKGIIFSRLTM